MRLCVPMPRSYVWPASWKGWPSTVRSVAVVTSRPDVGHVLDLRGLALGEVDDRFAPHACTRTRSPSGKRIGLPESRRRLDAPLLELRPR